MFVSDKEENHAVKTFWRKTQKDHLKMYAYRLVTLLKLFLKLLSSSMLIFTLRLIFKLSSSTNLMKIGENKKMHVLLLK